MPRAARASDRRAAGAAGGPAKDAGEDALERLLEIEQRLDVQLANARVEAARTLERARADAARLAADHGPRLKEALAALQDEVAAARDAEIQAIRERAGRERARYASVSGDRVEALARRVAARVAGLPGPT